MKLFCFSLVFIFLATSIVHAKSMRKPSSELGNIVCINEVYQLLDAWPEVENWHQYNILGDRFIVRGMAKNSKASISLYIENKLTIAKKIESGNELNVKFTKENECKSEVQAYSLESIDKPNYKFDDEDLDIAMDTSLKNGQAGIIYFWSPHMNLSATGVKEAQKIARDRGLVLITLLDPTADPAYSQKISLKNNLDKQSLRFMNSKVLSMMNVHNHYPSMLVFKNGSIITQVRPGYDEPTLLNKYLDEVLK